MIVVTRAWTKARVSLSRPRASPCRMSPRTTRADGATSCEAPRASTATSAPSRASDRARGTPIAPVPPVTRTSSFDDMPVSVLDEHAGPARPEPEVEQQQAIPRGQPLLHCGVFQVDEVVAADHVPLGGNVPGI